MRKESLPSEADFIVKELNKSGYDVRLWNGGWFTGFTMETPPGNIAVFVTSKIGEKEAKCTEWVGTLKDRFDSPENEYGGIDTIWTKYFWTGWKRSEKYKLELYDSGNAETGAQWQLRWVKA